MRHLPTVNFCYNLAMSAKEIIEIYISFFEKRGHKRIPNSSLVPVNDPTTLFTSSGMQPLVPFLLGEEHPQGNRLVDFQNCFRAQDIDEVGDKSHTTFFRMLGNWSLGDYFKKEEILWLFEFLTLELGLPKEKLYITVFKGNGNISYDQESEDLWKEVFGKENMEPKIFADETNWWSRSGSPDKMPVGEPGGPDTEVYFRFDSVEHNKDCEGDDPTKCKCGKFLEIANSVFMQYKKTEDGFEELPKKNVDFGGGLERLLAAAEDQSDIFQTSLFENRLKAIESETGKSYKGNEVAFRIIADHLAGAVFLVSNGINPSNKDQGYILRRLIRRSLDNIYDLNGRTTKEIIEAVVKDYKETDPDLDEKLEKIQDAITAEEEVYASTLGNGKILIEKELNKLGKKGEKEISADIAFKAISTYGLGPLQLKSLGYAFNDKELADKIKQHKDISRAGVTKKFAGGLADHSEATIKGHTATHLMHQAIRDLLGNEVHQSGSNITADRVRFDFNFDRNLTDDELQALEQTVNEKIQENLPVKFEIMSVDKAKEMGAIGLFDDKYSDKVKVYIIGEIKPYSVEFCGGPHVDWTGEVKSFKIIKQENIGNGLKRLYVKVG